MASKKTSAVRNAKTGSYTVRVPKSAATGKFVSETKPQGRIVVRSKAKKSS